MKTAFDGQKAHIQGIEMRFENPDWLPPPYSRRREIDVRFVVADISGDGPLTQLHCGLALITSALVDVKVYPLKTTEVDLIRVIGEALASLGYPADELRSFKS